MNIQYVNSVPSSVAELSEIVATFELDADTAYEAVSQFGFVRGVELCAKERIFFNIVDLYRGNTKSFSARNVNSFVSNMTNLVYELNRDTFLNDVSDSIQKEFV